MSAAALPRLAADAVKRGDAPRKARHHGVNDLAGAVAGAVVDGHDDHAVCGVVHPHEVLQAVLDHVFFVVGGHKDGHPWPVGADDAGVRVALFAKQPVENR